MPLTNFNNWNRSDRSVKMLHFDRSNPRLRGRKMSDSEVITEMIEEEYILEFARKIVGEGYMGVESMIAVMDGAKAIVVEGNRRLTVLKALTNPSLVTGTKKKSFEKLAKEFGANLPLKVSVVVAPNRAEADVYIYSKHHAGGSGFERKWKLMQQAVWVEQRLQEGMTIDELVADYPISESQIAEARAALQLLRLAPHTDTSDEVAKVMSDPKSTWYSTVIERLIKPPKCRKILKVDFDAESGLRYTGSEDEFMSALGKILTGALKDDNGEKGTRRFNKVEAAEKFLKGLNYAPKGARKSAGALVSKLNAAVPAQSKSAAKTVAKKKVAKKRREHRIFEPPLNGPLLAHRRRKVLEEIERMTPITDYENTLGVMLRVLLEITLRAALERVGSYKKLERRVGSAFGPALSDMLKYVIDGDSDIDLSASQIALFKSVRGARKTTMNKFIHGAHCPGTKADVEVLATSLRPVLDILLSAKKK